ncbi:hypothetical protein SLS60_010004 [Paraconiothyrium brasiliense]|uniref:NACHT domain-containing protein n=1 Tax=Paraconiothyrium brasiliense TaxID=300254 RepID=A0ABR3QT26_9PLEO
MAVWPKLFATTWKRHKLRFSGAIILMASRFDLISSRASVSEFDSFLHVSALEEEQNLAAMDRENLGRRQAVHAWLKPTEMENEQDHLARIRAAYPGTCRWLLDNETFKEWFDPKWLTTTSPTLLWLNGKPGSGKTVLASLVVEEARKLRPVPTVLFFYFKQEDNDRNDFLDMARTFLMQILEQNPQALDDFYSKCCSSGGVPLTSRALVGEYLKFALQNCDSAYMVLDGLDECSRRERGEIVSWFREILENPPQDAHDQLRCLFTIVNKPARAEREEAFMLLGWLVCAKRSLKMHEIQTMKSINLQGRTVDFERRRFLVDPKDLCESLVDVREDGTIELVHNTARSHLANNSYLNVVAEEIRLATLCINYLNLPSFRAPITEESVLAGEFGFMDYAILYWLRHLEAGLTSSSSRQDELFQDLAESLEVFVEQHWNNPTAKLSLIPNRTRDMLGIFSGSQRYLDIQLAVVLTDKELKYFGDIRREQRALDFADVASGVRCRLETVVRNNPAQSTIDDLELKYGTHLFKCPRFSCTYFTEGFSTSDERERHVERHKRPARCTDEHCRGSKIGFARQEDLARHMRENHPDMTERRHEFPTEEEISESVRERQPEPETGAEVEADAEAQPDPDLQTAEPAMTPVLEPAVPQPTRPTEASKRRKTKQDFECEHCHRKFTKKFNWQSHLATHSNNQTQCPYCDTTFRRSADLARHIKSLHDPDNVVMCGGVLSSGHHWGCGMKFARADILRTHHKSAKGKQCIAERDSEE